MVIIVSVVKIIFSMTDLTLIVIETQCFYFCDVFISLFT